MIFYFYVEMWDLIYFVGPSCVALLVCAFFRFFVFVKPKITDPVFAHYEAPADLSVMEAGGLLDDILQSKDLVYEIYDLYFKGVVSFVDGEFMALNIPKEGAAFAALSEMEQLILNVLFSGNAMRMRLDSVATRMKANVIKRYVYDSMVVKGFYEKASDRVRAPFYLISYTIISFSIGVNIFVFCDRIWDSHHSFFGNYNGFWLIPWSLCLGLIVAGFIIGYFGTLMSKMTDAGMKKVNELLGFKEFVITAEKDRIEFFMKNSPEVYKGILPYAFMFGVKEKWLAPVDDLGGNFMDEDLLKITFKMDLDGFEQLFEERRNVFIGVLNILFYVVIEAVKLGLSSSSFGRAFREYQDDAGVRSSGEESILELAAQEKIKSELTKKDE